MKTIFTRYYGATDTKPGRIVASDTDGNRVTAPYDCASSDPHLDTMLVRKMKWAPVCLAQGDAKTGEVFVMVPCSAYCGSDHGGVLHLIPCDPPPLKLKQLHYLRGMPETRKEA